MLFLSLTTYCNIYALIDFGRLVVLLLLLLSLLLLLLLLLILFKL